VVVHAMIWQLKSPIIFVIPAIKGT